MLKINIQSSQKNEKGIALIFSLIFLSLLLILALSFALDSMFDQKAAYNSANASSAGLLAKTQLNQVLCFVNNGSPDFENTTLYSGGNSDGASDGTNFDRDMLLDDSSSPQKYRSLLLTDGVIDSSNISTLCLNSSISEKDRISWKYYKDADGNITGRSAYVLIPNEKMPLSSLISDSVDESAGETANFDEKRIGKYVSEINVRNAMYEMSAGDPAATYTITPQMAKVLNYDSYASNPGKYNGTSWPDYDTLFGSDYLDLDSKIASDSDRTKFKQNFKNTFSLADVEDMEAFWVDIDGNNVINSDSSSSGFELYKRFDLTRSWEVTAPDTDLDFVRGNILLSTTGDSPDTDMENWVNADSGSSSQGLPWLATFGYKSDGTEDQSLKGSFSTVKERRNQIAANLKDYCDNDSSLSIPTSDVSPLSWFNNGSAVPTFTGNEETPYINKVGLKVVAKQWQMGSGPYEVWANIQVFPSVELINMYDAAFSESLTVRLKGTITFKTTVSTGGTTDVIYGPVDIDCDLSVGSGEWKDGYSKFVISNSAIYFNTVHETGITGSRKVDFEVVDITFTKVVLQSGAIGVGYDYVKNLSQTPNLAAVALNPGETEKSFWFGFAAHDPRQNLNGTNGTEPDWLTLTPVQNSDPTGVFSILWDSTDSVYYGKSNAENSTYGGGDDTVAPSAGDGGVTNEMDKETTTDPSNRGVSTAFIRNASMESPWELGFIHRAARWQTINLKKYDSSKGYNAVITVNGKKYLQGGGLYSSGDANILDQIKMTAKAKGPEKINLATQKDTILDALFSKIKLGCGIDNSMSVDSMIGLVPSSGNEIDFTNVSYYGDTTNGDASNGMRTNILKKFETSGTGNKTRACIADELSAFTSGTKDAFQEELIGKIINLTKVNDSPGDGNYTILVVAQTIKDVGGNGTNIKMYKTPADGSDPIEVPCQLGRFDIKGTGTTPDANWKKNAYGDDVTATQKILVTTSKINGKIKITSFQYID